MLQGGVDTRGRRGAPHYNQAVGDTALIACPHCDLVQRLPALRPGASARCPRCDDELHRAREDSLNRTLALALTAAVLYTIANSAPMLGLTVVGRQAFTTVFGGAEQLWRDGREVVACLVLFTAVIAPALQILLMLIVTLGARRDRIPAWIGELLRHLPTTRTWSMIEVMMLGVLVASSRSPSWPPSFRHRALRLGGADLRARRDAGEPRCARRVGAHRMGCARRAAWISGTSAGGAGAMNAAPPAPCNSGLQMRQPAACFAPAPGAAEGHCRAAAMRSPSQDREPAAHLRRS
jgi:paraquat-inducible protein A